MGEYRYYLHFAKAPSPDALTKFCAKCGTFREELPGAYSFMLREHTTSDGIKALLQSYFPDIEFVLCRCFWKSHVTK